MVVLFIVDYQHKEKKDVAGVKAIFSSIEKAKNYKLTLEKADKKNSVFSYTIYSTILNPEYNSFN